MDFSEFSVVGSEINLNFSEFSVVGSEISLNFSEFSAVVYEFIFVESNLTIFQINVSTSMNDSLNFEFSLLGL